MSNNLGWLMFGRRHRRGVGKTLTLVFVLAFIAGIGYAAITLNAITERIH
jgi:hypothetical protein